MFRKDLDLNGKVWHRIIKTAFFIIIIGLVYYIFTYHYPRYEQVDTFYDRLDNNITTPSQIVRKSEKIGQYLQTVTSTQYDMNSRYILGNNKVFCSKNTELLVETMSSDVGINIFKGNGPSELISKAEFIQYDITNNYKCITYSNIHGLDMIHSYIFLNNDMKIWKTNSYFKYEYILQNLGFLFLSIIVFILLYYKGVIYIVYGSKKK